MFDVSPLAPIARPIALTVAEVYWQHLQPWVVCLLIHGSAYKGGFIAGCSDIDFQVYVDPAAFEQNDALPLSMATAIYRDLARIDPAPFQYIQGYALPAQFVGRNPAEWIGPVPGSYHVIFGALPIPEATEQQVRERARRTLERVPRVIADVSHELLQHEGGKLERRVRFLCTDVWPTLYSLLTLQSEQPLDTWKLPKEGAIACLPEHDPLGRAIRAFYEGICAYYAGGQSVEAALFAIERGVEFLRAVEQVRNI